MKIVIIYGSPRKGITYECVNIVKEEMKKNGDVEFEEVFLPQDAPCFCNGCFSCFNYGEDKCPNSKYIIPIVDKIKNSDGIIISTPVYVMNITAGLKALFDHMAYCYLNHRPKFFKHKALVIITTAGAGISNCKKYIEQNLSFWGIGKILTFGKIMNASKWQEIPPKIKLSAEKELKLKASEFYNEVASKKINKPTFLQAIMFAISKALIKSFEQTNSDRIYWQNNGWLNHETEYYITEVKPNILQRLFGKAITKLIFKNSNK